MQIMLCTCWRKLQQKHILCTKYCRAVFSILDSICLFQCDNYLSIYNIDQLLSLWAAGKPKQSTSGQQNCAFCFLFQWGYYLRLAITSKKCIVLLCLTAQTSCTSYFVTLLLADVSDISTKVLGIPEPPLLTGKRKTIAFPSGVSSSPLAGGASTEWALDSSGVVLVQHWVESALTGSSE